MPINYGRDTSCLTDVGLVDVQITNPVQLIGQRLARRLQTPRGALAAINDDPNFGWDVRQYINGKISPATIAAAQTQIQAECLKDEQLSACAVTIEYVRSTGLMTIQIGAVTSQGPFTLTLTVDELTVGAVFSF